MTEPIPQEILDREHRRLCRHAAAIIVQAMAEADVSFEVMGARLGKNPATIKRWLLKLITADTDEFRTLSDLACAMDARVTLGVHCLPQETVERFMAPPAEVPADQLSPAELIARGQAMAEARAQESAAVTGGLTNSETQRRAAMTRNESKSGG